MSILVTGCGFVDVYLYTCEQGAQGQVNTWTVEHLQGVYKDIQELVKRIADKSYVFSDNVKDYHFPQRNALVVCLAP